MLKPQGTQFLPTLTLHLVLSIAFYAASPVSVQAAENLDGRAQGIFEVACVQCHALSPIKMLRDGPLGWKNTVHEMVMRGAQLSRAEADAVIRYLVQNYGPAASIMNPSPLPPFTTGQESGEVIHSLDVKLLPGSGDELVRGRCQICHDLGRVVSIRRSASDWRKITEDMTSRGIPASADEVDAIVGYLTTYFNLSH